MIGLGELRSGECERGPGTVHDVERERRKADSTGQTSPPRGSSRRPGGCNLLDIYRLPIDTGLVREPTYFVLASLLDGPLHGYAIIQRADESSGGRVKISVGTLYGSLERLLREELVEVDHEAVVDGRFRRSYSLTAAGRKALAEEARRMTSAAAAVLDHPTLTPARRRKSVSARPA